MTNGDHLLLENGQLILLRGIVCVFIWVLVQRIWDFYKHITDDDNDNLVDHMQRDAHNIRTNIIDQTDMVVND